MWDISLTHGGFFLSIFFWCRKCFLKIQLWILGFVYSKSSCESPQHNSLYPNGHPLKDQLVVSAWMNRKSANLILKGWVAWFHPFHPSIRLLKKTSHFGLGTPEKNGPDLGPTYPFFSWEFIFSFGARKFALLKVEPYWKHPPQSFCSGKKAERKVRSVRFFSSETLDGNWSLYHLYLDLHPQTIQMQVNRPYIQFLGRCNASQYFPHGCFLNNL